jgi:hypothetical protein
MRKVIVRTGGASWVSLGIKTSARSFPLLLISHYGVLPIAKHSCSYPSCARPTSSLAVMCP